jgi:glycosyltransferase involved in cell wall biosynthesis
LRVLHLGKFHPPHPGGIERFCAELAAAQQRSGLEPAVLAHASPGCRGATFCADGVPVRLVRCHGQMLFVPVSPGWPQALLQALREFRPQLLHLHLPNPSAFWLLGLPQARALPWLVHWHADVPDDSSHRGLRLAYPLYRLFERRLLERAGAVIATSARYRDASRPLASAAAKTTVVPLGIADAGAPAAAPCWPSAGLRLLAVGRLSFYKGFDRLLDALVDLPAASLLLIGSGDGETALRQRIAALGLGDRVRLLGQVDDPGLEAAYRACDLLCLPSLDRAEAFGMVLLEAMRAGKPVLASDIPGSGVGEVVQDGVTGRLLPIGDRVAWARVIGEMAADPQRRQAMGEAGRQRWEREFRIDPVAARISAIYRGLPGAPAAAGGQASRPAAAPGAGPDD